MDPRGIITPDAFEVSTALLGLPLARPWQRFVALMIDLVVIGIVTLLTKSFALVLGVVVAVLFIRASFKRTDVRGSVFGRAMRLSLGCMGVFVGIITAIIWAAVGIGGSADRGFSVDLDVPAGTVAGVSTPPSDADPANAVAGTAFVDDTGAVADTGAAADQDTLSSAAGASAAGASAVRDSLNALLARLDDAERRTRDRERQLAETREALADREGGFFSWLRNFVDELGFGFGWASLYLTVTLSWWNGLTVGKKVMGIRVLRLDGLPITWWVAFERAGGYAAGFATGLLGFAQVFWDANRQAIHDRIVGTVVVVDGADPVVNWERAL